MGCLLLACFVVRALADGAPPGTPTNTVVVSTAETVAKGKPIPIRYKLSDPRRVSIAIYDLQGHIVRELTRGVPRKAGRQQELWDTRDNNGKSLPPGDY